MSKEKIISWFMALSAVYIAWSSYTLVAVDKAQAIEKVIQDGRYESLKKDNKQLEEKVDSLGLALQDLSER